MQPDAATRILLALILLCLVILIVQGFTGRAPLAGDVGRYSVTGMRVGGPILVRTDSATGRVWKLELRDPAAAWQEFRDSDGDVPGAAKQPSVAPLDQPDQERPDPIGGDQTLQ